MSESAAPVPAKEEYILGIDLGSSSVGWAMIRCPDGNPSGIIHIGSRVFDAGMEGNIEEGKEESRNLARRNARLQRRQTWRRARRMKKIFGLLQRFNMLPKEMCATSEDRQDLLNRLDQQIRKSEWFKRIKESGSVPEPEQVLPYLLRAAALDEKLEPYFLGRAFYHLAQRRGYLSNRKQTTAKKKDDDEGVVKEGIAKLRSEMESAKSRTLGEYLSRISPSDERIRVRWTARKMFEDEFDAICNAQESHVESLLGEERRELLRKAMFHQRPLKIQRNLIGVCELEPKKRRAPAYLLSSQRFRLLQKVNDLTILIPGEKESDLTPDQRGILLEALAQQGDRTFTQLRKLLKLPKGTTFNLEKGGEEKIPGNRTAQKFHDVLGQRWLQMNSAEQDRFVAYVFSFKNFDKLAAAAMKKWSLSSETSEKLAKITFEPDYMSLSRRAIEKLLPLLEEGISYATARKRLYPEKFEAAEPQAFLPPVTKAFPVIRNPAVMRSLTELRKVVNTIIRKYGKPFEIRIELARDLRNTKKQRENISKKNRDNQKARTANAQRIVSETDNPQPTRNDILKAQLWEECRGICPYTGKTIPFKSLFGAEPQFDIEHIVPFSRCLDDSYVNKSLCEVQENRHVKGNRTPWEAYAGHEEKYEEILRRVKNFQGPVAEEKLRRFLMTETEAAEFVSDFTSRQLNDTRYASRLAADYLGILYGGRVDENHVRNVHTTGGQVTAFLRDEWKLNRILNDGPTNDGGKVPKSRDDHRHHAVDAVVIALTENKMIERLSRAAELAPSQRRRRFASVEGPWPNFVDTVREKVDEIVVSHRVSKKVSGALHEETIYSPPKPDIRPDGSVGKQPFSHVRKPLAAMTKNDVENIVDTAVRQAVQEKLAALGGDPKKAFADPKNLPALTARDGRTIPIKRVRVKKKLPTFALGSGRTARHVTPEANHHLEIFAEVDENDRETGWDGVVVSMAEAYRRQRNGEPVVQRNHGPHTVFKFSLAPGEVIECNDGPEKRRLLVVRSLSRYSSGSIVIGLVPLQDARIKKEIQASGDWLFPGPTRLREWNARKVVASPIGDISEAYD